MCQAEVVQQLRDTSKFVTIWTKIHHEVIRDLNDEPVGVFPFDVYVVAVVPRVPDE